MPAWSVPGSHNVGRPRIRAVLAMISCEAALFTVKNYLSIPNSGVDQILNGTSVELEVELEPKDHRHGASRGVTVGLAAAASK